MVCLFCLLVSPRLFLYVIVLCTFACVERSARNKDNKPQGVSSFFRNYRNPYMCYTLSLYWNFQRLLDNSTMCPENGKTFHNVKLNSLFDMKLSEKCKIDQEILLTFMINQLLPSDTCTHLHIGRHLLMWRFDVLSPIAQRLISQDKIAPSFCPIVKILIEYQILLKHFTFLSDWQFYLIYFCWIH